MKKKIFILFFILSCFFPFNQVKAISFPKMDALITPLAVGDGSSILMLGGMTGQQILTAIVSITDFINRQQLELAMSLNGFPFDKRVAGLRYLIPQIEPWRGSDVGISVLFSKGVTVEDSHAVSRAVEQEVMVARETSAAGVQLEQKKRNLFSQENVIIAMADALYYESLIQELQKTLDELSQSADVKEDKNGAVTANYKYMEAWYRLLTLLEQIKAERVMLKASQGIVDGQPILDSVLTSG